LKAAQRLFDHLATKIDVPLSIQLWDGTVVPLGAGAPPDKGFKISGPGVIGSLLRNPTLDKLFQHYVRGHIE